MNWWVARHGSNAAGNRAALAQVGAALVQEWLWPLYRKIGGNRKRPGERREAENAAGRVKSPQRVAKGDRMKHEKETA